jgi:hypothetical protein
MIFGGCGRSPDEWAQRGITALNEGNPSRSVKSLNKALEGLDPESSTADSGPLWEALGLAYHRQGNLA